MDRYVQFPLDPSDGMVFEVSKGIYYAYDLQSNSWNRLNSVASALPVATNTDPGLMAAEDVKKLNKLLLPPLRATIGSDNCPTRFTRGTVGFKSADNIINVTGDALMTNVDDQGKRTSETLPFQVHENTYAYDFTIDMDQLTDALASVGNYISKGTPGDRGPKGPTGDKGTSFVLSGPPGEQGAQGSAPECTLRLEPETFAVESGGKALTDVRVVLNNCEPGTYKLEFDRQSVGQYAPVSKIKLKDADSKWLLALTSVDSPSRAYYIDMTEIENAIRDKYEQEIARLKAGYEKVTNYWLDKMNTLFNEQKQALCVTLEYAESVKKNAALRQHMESVAATAAIAGAKITLHTRNDPITSNTSGNTALNTSLTLQGQDAPAGLTGLPFPQPPNTFSRANSGVTPVPFSLREEALSQAIDTTQDQFFVVMRGNDLYVSGAVSVVGEGLYRGNLFAYRSYKGLPLGVSSWTMSDRPEIGQYEFKVDVPGIGTEPLGDNFKTFNFTIPYDRMNAGVHIQDDHQVSWEKYGNPIGSAGGFNAFAQAAEQTLSDVHELDAKLYFGSSNAYSVVVPEGTYQIEILNTTAFVDGRYRADIRVVSGNITQRILDKGSFGSPEESNLAYAGLSMNINHRGGKIDVYLPSLDPTKANGSVHFSLKRKSSDLGYLQNVAIAAEIKQDFLKGYSAAARSHVLGQDYTMICLSTRLAKMLGYDTTVSVAFAWPSSINGDLMPLSGFEFGQDLDLQAQLVSNVGERNGNCSPQIILFAVVT